MLKLMKFITLFLILSQIFALNLKSLQANNTNTEIINNTTEVVNNTTEIIITTEPDYYYVFDDWYYSYTPVYYTYTPTSYYYVCEWWYFPSACDTTYVLYRKNQLKTGDKITSAKKNENAKKEFKTENLEKQIKALKKEIFGKENYSTKELRKNNKVYDPRWLLAQLKISRLFFLEDEVIKNKK
jgi:hypothetical protein